MGIIALAGGNEFRENCVLMDKRLLALLPKSAPRVVIIPAAAVQGSPRMAAENGVRHFRALGAEASGPLVVTRADANNPALFPNLENADMVYLAGGDPGYLLDVLRDSALFRAMQAVYARGGIIAGSSAGAMVLSARMRVWNKGEWVPGLAMASQVAVLVHHRGPDSGVLATIQNSPLPIVGIAEASACFSADGGTTWESAGIGGVTVYDPKTAQAAHYKHGASFTLGERPAP